MATAAATTPKIPDLIVKLQQAHAARKDALDLPRTMTARQITDYEKQTSDHLTTISALRNLPEELAKLTARIEALDARKAAMRQKEQEFETAIAAFTDWRLVPDGRDRDREYDRQRETRRGLERLREGSLLAAPGVVYERIEDLDRRIAELQQRADSARSTLDAYLKAAEQLLGETVPG